MMATTSRGRPGQSGGSVGTDDMSSSHSGSIHSGSLGDQDPNHTDGSIPESLDITVVLPDGTEKQYTVDYQKQMMDLLVQVAVSNKLSPPSHKFHIVNEETARPVDFLASQSIGSLGYSLLYLINKKADKKDTDIFVGQHELTKRFLVNLPRNQKTVIRVSMSISLAELYKMICAEKNLDPYKYELRHPTQPDEPLNMAAPLKTYGITEITVVAVTGGGGERNSGQITHRSTSDLPDGTRTSSYSSDVGFSTVPRSGHTTATPAHSSAMDSGGDYMPGMEKKKKKGILSFFQRKKGGKFNVSEVTYASESQVASSSISPPPAHTSTITRSRTQPLHSEPVKEQPIRSLSSHSSQSSQGFAGLKQVPEKPPRKKRLAPPPPPAKAALQVQTEPTKPAPVDVTHSRTSSHSSGFDETTNSPLESPGNSSRESDNTKNIKKSGNTLTSLETSDVIATERAGRVENSQTRELISQTSAISVSSSDSTLPKTGKKKRKAPPPPPGSQKSVVVAVVEERAVTPSVDSAHSSPVHTADRADKSPNKPLGSSTVEDAIIDEQLKTALVDELKKGPIEPSQGQGQNVSEGQSESGLQLNLEPPTTNPDTPSEAHDEAAYQSEPSTDHKPRLCEFFPPPPPESPPPPQTPNTAPTESPFYSTNSIEVMDSTTQVHVTTRDSLSSEYSCCVDSDTSDVDDLLNDLDLASLGSSAVAELRLGDKEANEHVYSTEGSKRKSDIAVFVEQMEELTEYANKDVPVAETEEAESSDKEEISEEKFQSMDFVEEENIVHKHENNGYEGETQTVTQSETFTVNGSLAMYQEEPEERDTDSDVEPLPDIHSDGVVLLNKSDYSEFKAVTNIYVNPEDNEQIEQTMDIKQEMSPSPEHTAKVNIGYTDQVNKSIEITHELSQIRSSLHSEDSVSDSEHESRREVTKEELSFADEVMASFKDQDFDDEVAEKPRYMVNSHAFDAQKMVIQPNFDDLSMDEEITFDFEQSDVMFVPPTPPKTEYVKEEISAKSSFNPESIPDPIIESTAEYEEACEQFSENVDQVAVESNLLQEDAIAVGTAISYNEPLTPAPEEFRQESPPPHFREESPPQQFRQEVTEPEIKKESSHKQDKARHETWHGNSITYMAPRNNNTRSEMNYFDDDGFKSSAIPLPKRKANNASGPVAEPEPVPEPEPVKIRSLRDAYRKPEKSEPETIIISKEKPLPVFEAKPDRVLPERRRISTGTELPKQDSNQPEEGNRRRTVAAVPVTFENPEPTEDDRQRVSFWGPRPWSARATSEPSIRDVRMALAVAQEQNTQESSLNGDVNHNHKGSDAREQCSQIGYEPASAEEIDPMLEEKSISMNMSSLPGVQVERKSIYTGKSLNRYGTSMGLVTSAVNATQSNTASRPAAHKSSENIDQKEKTKKSLHEQYGELQQQFGKWQMQLVENQKLLANKKIVPKEEGKALEELQKVVPEPPPPPKQEPIRRETTSFVTSAAKKEGRHSSSSSQSSGYGGLFDRFSPDELIAQKSILRNSSLDETSTSFNGDSTTTVKPRHSSVPAYYSPPESSKIKLGKVVPNPPKAESYVPPPPPPAPAMSHPPAPSSATKGAVKTWGTRINAKKPQPQSKFGPQVSPREELMLAIRTAGGRNVLKKVPVNETNWFYNGPPSC